MVRKKQVEKPVQPEPVVPTTMNLDVPQAGVVFKSVPESTFTFSAPSPIVESVVEPVAEPEPVREPETVMVEVLVGALSIEWPVDVQPYTGSKRFVRGTRLELPFSRAKRLEFERSVRIL